MDADVVRPTASAVDFDAGKSKLTTNIACAECQKLKVQCDRVMPVCRSCTKRLASCVYPISARELLSVRTLNDRLLIVENALAISPAYLNPLHPSSHPPEPPLAFRRSGSSLLIPQAKFQSLFLKDLNIDPPTLDWTGAAPNRSFLYDPPSLPPLSAYYASQLFINSPSGWGVSALTPSVTPALLALLPLSAARPRLLDLVGEILAVSPVGSLMGESGWVGTRTRIERLTDGGVCDSSGISDTLRPRTASGLKRGRGEDGEGGATQRKRAATNPGPLSIPDGQSPSQFATVDSPTIEFFAMAAAVFAVGHLVAAESDRGSDASSEDKRENARRLLALSEQAVGVYESHLEGRGAQLRDAYSTEYVAACVVQVVCLIRMKRMVTLPILLGKMVGVARTMALNVEPKTSKGVDRYELGRRIWWDLVYYDCFISDFFEQSPLIGEGSFSTRVPAMLSNDSPTSFFQLKCRLAQLIRTVKLRRNRQPYTLEIAGTCELEVNRFLNGLPQEWHLREDDTILDSDSPVLLADSTASLAPNQFNMSSPFFLAQRCELAMFAHRLIFNIYLPFAVPQSNSTHETPGQATLGMLNASHNIIHAAKTLQDMWNEHESREFSVRPIPETFLLYPIPRTLLEAAVLSGHAVVTNPTGLWVKEAISDCTRALLVLQDPLMGGKDVKTSAAYQLLVIVQKLASAVQRTRRRYTKKPTTEASDINNEEVQQDPSSQNGTTKRKKKVVNQPVQFKTPATEPVLFRPTKAGEGSSASPAPRPQNGLRSRSATPRVSPSISTSLSAWNMPSLSAAGFPSANKSQPEPMDFDFNMFPQASMVFEEGISFADMQPEPSTVERYQEQFTVPVLGRARSSTHSGNYGATSGEPMYHYNPWYPGLATEQHQDEATLAAQREVVLTPQRQVREESQNASQPVQNGSYGTEAYGGTGVPLAASLPSYGSGFEVTITPSSSMDYFPPSSTHQLSIDPRRPQLPRVRHHSDLPPSQPSTRMCASNYANTSGYDGSTNQYINAYGDDVPLGGQSVNSGAEWAAMQEEGFNYY